MTDHLVTRRVWVVAAVAALICLLALSVSHSGVHSVFAACVLFFPVFLFGLLDPLQLLGATLPSGEATLPDAPIFSTLFQRPPPTFD